MHLVIVSPYPPAITGIGQYGYHISRTLADSRAFSHITLLTGQATNGGAFDAPAGVRVERVWRPNRADAGARVIARLRQLQPEVVWFNLGATVFGHSAPANISGLLGPAVTRRLGIPSVLTMHEMPELADLRLLRAPGGPLGTLAARWVTWALTRADIVCVTLRHYMEWLVAHRPGTRAIHIPIGMYDTPQTLAEPAVPSLLFFTSVAPFKGLELLLEAHRRLRDRIPNLELTVAGAEHPRFRGYLAHVQEQHRCLAGVRWLGHVPEAGVRDIFRRCQVVVLPYTAATGSSSVLYQAMMWGRSVVAAGLPELRSAVHEAGLRAEFFSSGNVADLARAVERLLHSPDLRAQQVRWNCQAIGRLGLDETCRAYLRAFDLAIQVHRARRRIGIPQDISTESIR